MTASKLGGTPFIARNADWPCCGVCSSPMDLFLQLNSRDLPAELADPFSGLLQVFLCTAEGVPHWHVLPRIRKTLESLNA